MKNGFSDPGVLTKKHGEEFEIRSWEMDRQLYMVWGEMDELGSIMKEDQKKLTGMIIAVCCQLSIILLVDGLMEILVVASGYCAV